MKYKSYKGGTIMSDSRLEAEMAVVMRFLLKTEKYEGHK